MKHGDEIEDIAGERRTLKIIPPSNENDYTRFFLDDLRSSRTVSYTHLDVYKRQIYEHLADGGALYVFHADTEGLNFRNAVRKVGFHPVSYTHLPAVPPDQTHQWTFSVSRIPHPLALSLFWDCI